MTDDTVIRTSNSYDIRAEIRELREFGRALPSIALLELAQRLEDIAHPENAPPFKPPSPETPEQLVCRKCGSSDVMPWPTAQKAAVQRHSRDCDCTSCHYSKKHPQVKPHHATCGCFECAPRPETPAGPVPHGVMYDRPGWVCSICGFWNNIKDRHCAGIHLESDGPELKADEPLTCNGYCRYADSGQFIRDPDCPIHGNAQKARTCDWPDTHVQPCDCSVNGGKP